MDKQRVVVTGLGMVSPLGESVNEFWKAITNGSNLFSKLSQEKINDTGVSIAGEIKSLNSEEYFTKREARKMDKFVQYALIASTQALNDANVVLESLDSQRFGVVMGTQFGGVQTWEDQMHILYERGPKRISPYFVPMMIVNMATGQVSMNFGAKGPNTTPVTGMCSGANAIGDAYNLILNNDADIMLCGGSDASLTPPILGGYKGQGLISKQEESEYISQPFSKNASGFVMSEGAGVLVLESLDHAKKRNAEIYCEIVGYGSSFGLDKDSNTPTNEGIVASIESALIDADLDFRAIKYINASGIGLPVVDNQEIKSLNNLLKKYEHQLHISSMKSLIGNFMGASGAIDSIVSINALKHGSIPADIYKSHEMVEASILDDPISGEIDFVLNNTIDLNGFNTSLIFKRWEQ